MTVESHPISIQTIHSMKRHPNRPRFCVWELTLQCNLRCVHCGSAAGTPREDELELSECLALIPELAALGCECISLSGGEPTLHPHWDTIARAIADAGIYVNMVTNGIYPGSTPASEIAIRARDAGMCNVALSVDGPQPVHDRIRGVGTFARTSAALAAFRDAGMKTAIITTISRLNIDLLETIRELAIEAGVSDWRVQIAKPMGTMKENSDLVIGLNSLPSLMADLARLKRQRGIRLEVGDSLGYYGPNERLLRSRDGRARPGRWSGCQAGLQVIGIQSDGTIKGCLSQQTHIDGRDPWVEGSVRDSSLTEIWTRPGAFAFNREWKQEDLTGFCARCRHARVCRGGASCIASAMTGKLGEDPYCEYRLQKLHQEQTPSRVARSAAAAAAAIAVGMCSPACTPTGSDADTAPVLSNPGTELPAEDDGLWNLIAGEPGELAQANIEYMAPLPYDDEPRPEYMAPHFPEPEPEPIPLPVPIPEGTGEPVEPEPPVVTPDYMAPIPNEPPVPMPEYMAPMRHEDESE